MNTNPPTLGQTIIVHGITCVIVRILPFGTLYVESREGHFFRVTGLSFR